MAGQKRARAAEGKPATAAGETGELPSASALDEYKARVLKRQHRLAPVLAGSAAGAPGVADIAPAAPVAPSARGDKDAQIAQLTAELELLRSKHAAFRAIRETEPERLHAQALASAADAARAADVLVRKLRAEKAKLLDDMGELSGAVGGVEAIVAERDALVADNARLLAELERVRKAPPGAPASPAERPPATTQGAAPLDAGVVLRLRMYEILTGLTLDVVQADDGPAVICRGTQRGGRACDELRFSLFSEQLARCAANLESAPCSPRAHESDGSAEVEFDIIACSLRGAAAEALPPTGISFAPREGCAFFTRIARALCTPPPADGVSAEAAGVHN